MISIVIYQNPIFYEEESILLIHRKKTESSFDKLIYYFTITQDHSIGNNHQVDELLHFKSLAFNEMAIQNSIISYLSKVGEQSRKILDLIEKKRYELRLFDNKTFEYNYERVRTYLDFVLDSRLKLIEIEKAYHSNLKYLMN